jgi:type II secretory pathway predicted ATPase ExeA
MDIDAIIKYFGLNEHPFISNPDPRFLYFTSQVKEALAKCEFMARDRDRALLHRFSGKF